MVIVVEVVVLVVEVALVVEVVVAVITITSNGHSVMVFSHQSKTTTCQTWCERHHRNAQVKHLSCRCLALV